MKTYKHGNIQFSRNHRGWRTRPTRSAWHSGAPGPGFQLDSDGDYDLQNKKLVSPATPTTDEVTAVANVEFVNITDEKLTRDLEQYVRKSPRPRIRTMLSDTWWITFPRVSWTECDTHWPGRLRRLPSPDQQKGLGVHRHQRRWQQHWWIPRTARIQSQPARGQQVHIDHGILLPGINHQVPVLFSPKGGTAHYLKQLLVFEKDSSELSLTVKLTRRASDSSVGRLILYAVRGYTWKVPPGGLWCVVCCRKRPNGGGDRPEQERKTFAGDSEPVQRLSWRCRECLLLQGYGGRAKQETDASAKTLVVAAQNKITTEYKKYVDEFHLTPSGLEDNPFKYLMEDIDESSSENNICPPHYPIRCIPTPYQ